MNVVTDIKGLSGQNYVATIGVFDGVHRGHRYLIDFVCQLAQSKGLKSMVVTFSEHPAVVLGHEAPPQLLTLDEKLAQIAQAGVDTCVVLPFSREMAALSAADFMQQVLRDALCVEVLVMGYDHRFGSERESDFSFYQRLGNHFGIEVVRAKRFGKVSSSRIRQLLHEGKMEEAGEMLGYAYRFRGIVIDGDKRGRKLGFPTANLRVDARKQLPCPGVYSARVEWNGRLYKGMMNIGSSPTFLSNGIRPPEVHILQFDEDIYGEELTVEPVRRLRSERSFQTVDELVSQLKSDAVAAEKITL